MRDLVVVRAGFNSLHPTWCPDGESSRWRTIVSYYGASADQYRDRWPRYDYPGGKFESTVQLFTDHPALLDDVRYVWLVDDDITIDPAYVTRLFDATEYYGLALTQPALSPDSYVNVPITRQHPGCILRRTNYVEVMAPCFKKELLVNLLPLFWGLRYGWELDHYWGNVAEQYGGSAIFDFFTMTHTRAHGTGELYRLGSADPAAEAARLVARLGETHFTAPRVTGVIYESGVEIGPGIALDRFLKNPELEISRRNR